ncbi:MAG: prolyl oligopeptidase family serine peptidase [Armatimonadota bacterium]|nr:prolyl oligopeptidase family serine peptidase [Armatimonadota bacterium]
MMKGIAMGLSLTMSVNLHGQKVELPDPLARPDGGRIESVAEWQKRRPEILELFRTHIYGRAPVDRPDSLKFETTTTPGMMEGAATRKQIKISYTGRGGQGAINLTLFIPVKPAKPAPCFVLICNRGPRNIDPTRAIKSEFWPAEEIVARGYAAAAFLVADVAPDHKDNFKEGVFGIFDPPGPRAADAWGTIAAWAWGASRVMDYLQTDPDIDARRVAVVGHSRGGKTALWAGAQDERFALVISNDSGSTGAALARGKVGEKIKDINKTFPYWFAENYKQYNDRENELPVDQHMLIALIAPRLLYIASASEDEWADPAAEFMAGVAATPVYRLFGLEGLTMTEVPKPESPLHEGHIGHHIRTGGHGLTAYDWHRFMDFADKHWGKLSDSNEQKN